jgi:hypothetical protein
MAVFHVLAHVAAILALLAAYHALLHHLQAGL